MCKRVLYYCHRLATQLQLTNISCNIIDELYKQGIGSSIPIGGKEFSFLRTTVREQFWDPPSLRCSGYGAVFSMEQGGISYLSLPSGAENKCVCSCNSTLHILCFKSVEVVSVLLSVMLSEYM